MKFMIEYAFSEVLSEAASKGQLLFWQVQKQKSRPKASFPLFNIMF